MKDGNFYHSEPQSCSGRTPSLRAIDLAKPIVGRGSAFADIDGDGDQDVSLTQAGRAPLLLRNDQDLGHHWLRVKLVGEAVIWPDGTRDEREPPAVDQLIVIDKK